MTVLDDILSHDDRSPVLFLTNDFPPDRGGIQTFVRQMCADLPASRVVVYTSSHPNAAEHDRECPFPVIRDPRRVLLPVPGLTRRVQRVMATHGCRTVVFGASVPLGVLAPALRGAGARHQVALTHGHEVWWAALPGFRHVLQHVANHVDVVTYVSDYTRDRLAPALRATSSSFVKLTPRADPSFNPRVDGRWVRRLHDIPENSMVVVCVARLVRRKGQDRLVRIWPRVLRSFPEARLLIVGEGPDRRRLRRMVARRGLQSHVVFTGEVAATPPYYAAADVFSMPVRNRFLGLEVEALGISFLEALATGLTVVPGRHGGTPETLRPWVGPRHRTGADPRPSAQAAQLADVEEASARISSHESA